jgi:uncharacterized repeat protein (TIGR03803 family)
MEKILHRFRHYSDGAYPNAGLTNVNGTLFGTTWLGGSGCGGSGSCGTVYSVTTTGKEKVLYSFAGGSDGANPLASLKEVKGVLYGTTENGGGSGCFSRGCGTVFSITTTGTEKVLHRFGVGSDGANPVAGLIDVKGTLYGTTENGGSTRCGNGCGTMYSISTSGTEKVLHAFDKETAFPAASLIDVNGTLYGTTASGVNRDAGTVFKATTTGVVRVLHYFDFITDGGDLRASLLNVNGTLYGTTYYGPPHFGRPHYWGTVFTVVP